MYSKAPGMGLSPALESTAMERGYQQIVLSTRILNLGAVNFYLRNGYEQIRPYGKYKNSNKSICMAKALLNTF